MNPKNYKNFKEDIAEEVGVHKNVVDNFIDFYYACLRKNLSGLTHPRVFVDGLGTFVIRKKKLDKAIKRHKSILGNIGKQTYNGYEKSMAVTKKLEELSKMQDMYQHNINKKKEFIEKKKGL